MTDKLAPFFGREVLQDTRLIVAEVLPIGELPLTSVLRRCGLYIPNPSTIAAITFGDVVAARDPLPIRVLFHELVHVVQYRALGVEEFARQYVEGFLVEGAYLGIPLESCAVTLEEHFATDAAPFSVESAVRRWTPSADHP